MVVLDQYDDNTEVGIAYHLQEKLLTAVAFIDFPATGILFPNGMVCMSQVLGPVHDDSQYSKQWATK